MKRRFWRISALYSFFIFILLTLGVHFHLFDRLDEQIMLFVNRLEHPMLTVFFKTVTHIGSFLGTVIIWALLTTYCLVRKWHDEAVLLTITTFSTPFVNIIMKKLFSRPRLEINSLIDIGGYSYPSGHAMYAASLYGMILILFWVKCRHTWQRVTLLAVTSFMFGSIASSRIYLGVHYPSDIIGGMLLSLSIVSTGLYLFYLRQENNKHPFAR